MAVLTGWRLELKKKYGLPLMFSKIMFKECETEEECLEYIAKTEGSLCWSCLDYKDSQEVIRLRYEWKNKA